MAMARQHDGRAGPFVGGVAFYPYQVSLGATVRYWPDDRLPSIRVHVGPFKVWGGVVFRRNT